MTETHSLAATVSAAVMDSEAEHRRLLQSIVDVARAIFGAAASSIFLLDEAAGELVFEAVSGAGQGFLVGRRFPADQGIAGWVIGAREAAVVDDLSTDTTFARGFASSTAYVPSSLMATPLLDDENVVGVLEVLDSSRRRSALGDIDVLSLFGQQAAIALRIVQRNRAAGRRLAEDGGDYRAVVGLTRSLERAGAARREAGLTLLRSMEKLLSTP
jgi:GAF domain-containing protein